MFTVYKPKRRRNGKLIVASTYSGRFTVGKDGKIYQVALGVTDKQLARQLLNEKRKEMEREMAGLIAPRLEREAAKAPLLDLVEECIAAKSTQGKDDRYLRQVRCQMERLAKECGWCVVGDISAGAFERWRSQTKVSAKTLNGYLNAASSVCSWLVKTRRLAENPLRYVEKIVTAGKETYGRRALSEAEFQRLIEVSGERAPVYVVAAYTGLRRSELRALEWRDVHLDTPQPFVRLRGETTKSGKGEDLPLNRDVVTALRVVLPAKAAPKERVFNLRVPRMPRFYKDLEAAGIPKSDAEERRVHFHSLRYTFCTALAVHGVSDRERKSLMRHSDIRLTEKIYTDTKHLPLSPAVERLPSVGDALIYALNNAQSVVSECPELSGSVPQTEENAISQLPQNKPLKSSNVPVCPPVSGKKKWCAIQGSNL